MDRVALVPVMYLAISLGCGGGGSTVTSERGEETPAPATPAPDALRVAPERVTRIRLTQPGGDSATLERVADGEWRVVAPLDHPANALAVDAILEVLAEIEIDRRVADHPRPEDRLGNDGIGVRIWRDDGAARDFRVGASTGDETLVQVAHDAPVYAVRGRCRHRFDRTLAELRDPIITQLDVAAVERVVYANRSGRLELVADATHPGRFVEPRPAIPGFDGDRASQGVAVLAALRAKGFVDAPAAQTDTGLFEEDTATATLWLRGREAPLTVWVGARTPDRKLHLRTSDSEQIFLVSAHLASSLVPRAEHFERSEEMLRELAAQAAALEAARVDGSEAHGDGHSGDHSHGAPPPTEVPIDLLRELRAIASAQRGRSEPIPPQGDVSDQR